MIICNSAASMTASSYCSKKTSSTSTTSYKPVVQLGGITLVRADDSNQNTNAATSSTGLTIKNENGSFLSSLNYALDSKGQLSEVDDSLLSKNSGKSNRMVQMQTMNYLLRMLLYGSWQNGNSVFSDAFDSLFENSTTCLVTNESTYEYEMAQSATYSAEGTVICADGRELSFNYAFSMSSSFREYYCESSQSVQELNLTDPLVINLDSNPASVSDQKFYFDLDADGEDEYISRLGQGSGFLAIDKNEDGQINDGSELFGVQSGDGFKDLAAFDEDGNGWIDEADSIYSKLRIWTVSDSGENELYTLKQSDIGAIYLAKAKINYTYYDDDKETQAVIRSSGIYLHESTGKAGGVQHLDMAT